MDLVDLVDTAGPRVPCSSVLNPLCACPTQGPNETLDITNGSLFGPEAYWSYGLTVGDSSSKDGEEDGPRHDESYDVPIVPFRTWSLVILSGRR